MPKPKTIGDLLKSEADPQSREAISVTGDIKCGQPVLYPKRNQYLIALSDSENGKVLVQPHNCVIFADNIDADALSAIQISRETGVNKEDAGNSETHALTLADLVAQGDKYGITYISNKTDS